MDEGFDEGMDASADMDVSDADMSSDILDDIPEDIPEDVPDDIPEDIPEDVPDDIQEDIPEDVPEDVSDDIEDDIPEDTPEDTEADVEDMAEDVPEDIPEDVPEDTEADVEDMAEDVSEDIPEDVPEDTEADVEDMAEEIPEDIPEDVLEDTGTDAEDIGEDILEDVGAEVNNDVADTDAMDVDSEADIEEAPTNVEDADTVDVDSEAGAEEAPSADEDTENTDVEAETEEAPTDVGEVDTVDVDSETDTEGAPSDVEDTENTDVEAETEEVSADEEDVGVEEVDSEADTEEAPPDIENTENTDVEAPTGVEDADRTEGDAEEMPAGVEVADATDLDAKVDTEEATTGVENVASEMKDVSAMDKLSTYMNEHNYGPDDFAEYSQDPEWRALHREVYPDYEMPKLSQETARVQLTQYMNQHNYGIDDYTEYSQDPVWKELHDTVYPEEVIESSLQDNSILDSQNNEMLSDDMVSASIMLEKFGVSETPNGTDYFVHGAHYEQFEREYYSPEETKYIPFDNPIEKEISPSLIEGIHLGKSEVENPDVFWSQHEKGGTAESFQEIARYIPEVKERLAGGETLQELCEDSKLGTCASIYFKNKPKVVENDGYFEFDSNGRHRILAARALGYDIPVEVIGNRVRTDSDSLNFGSEPILETSVIYNKEQDIITTEAPEQFENSSIGEVESYRVNPNNQRGVNQILFTPDAIETSESKEYSDIVNALDAAKVEYRKPEYVDEMCSEPEIIDRISGGDLTRGSCSSLALAYAGNKAGLDVLDFRDGDSRSIFSSRNTIHSLSCMPGIQSNEVSGTDDIESVKELITKMQPEKEYYLASGQHAAIVKKTNEGMQYLELQHPSAGNGWHNLNESVLINRFGCSRTHKMPFANYLMDVESLSKSKEFKSILGYINTAKKEQRKGQSGNVR